MKMSFADWMLAVDKACWAICGVSINDLPDCCFADWHADGVTPKAAAKKAIKIYKDEF